MVQSCYISPVRVFLCDDELLIQQAVLLGLRGGGGGLWWWATLVGSERWAASVPQKTARTYPAKQGI